MNILAQILKALFQLLEATLNFLAESLETLFSSVPKKSQGYNADFAPSGSILSSWNHGFCLTGKSNLTVKDSYQNALVIGGTGVGKSSVVLLPSLYSMKGSYVVHDPSGELHAKSAAYLKGQGYTVLILNFSDPLRSAGYNFLSRANTASAMQKVSFMLVEGGSDRKSKNDFWNVQAIALITMLIMILKKKEPEYQNLYNVRQLLNKLGSNPKEVDALFSKDADEVLFGEYKSFIAYDEKVVNGVIATAKAALQIFSDEAVAKVTASDTIDLQDFRRGPVALFLQTSVADQKYYSGLISLFFEQLFAFILGRFPLAAEKDIFLLIDEASALNLPTLPLAVANVRKHRAGTMILVQDFAQLIHHYGKFDAEAIKSNCFAKMYFTGQSLETASELEKTLGRYEYEEENGKKVVRALMTNDEIRTMKTSQALLICGHHPPIMARLRPYYKNYRYRHYSALPVPLLPPLSPPVGNRFEPAFSEAHLPVPVLKLNPDQKP